MIDWLSKVIIASTWCLLVPPAYSVPNRPPDIKLMRVPEGGLQPQAALDVEGTLHLVYLKGDPRACDVMYCCRKAGQAEFSAPTRVNGIGGSAIAMGTVRGAQLALGRGGRMHVVWNGSDKAPRGVGGGAPMLYARQTEHGEGFEPERNIITTTTHLDGGGSVAADEQGNVYVVWHGHRLTGPQEEIDRGVFLARSSDDGRSFSPERQVNPPETGACGCCGLKAFADNKGELAILYRSATLQGNRDSELLLSTNRGESFSARVLGQWHVSTCPMSTHGLGLGPGGLFAMWERQGEICFESLRNEGGSVLRGCLGSGGKSKHPAFAFDPAPNAACLVAWTEGTGWEKGGELAWACLDASGTRVASGRVPGVPVWSYAAVVPGAAGSFTLIY